MEDRKQAHKNTDMDPERSKIQQCFSHLGKLRKAGEIGQEVAAQGCLSVSCDVLS